jgi:hypothetical protein
MNEVTLARQQRLDCVGEIAGNLAHPQPAGDCGYPGDLYSSGRQLNKNSTRNRCSPLVVQTSTVKKSVATMSSQCWVRNSRHVVLRLRSGAGSMPCLFRMSAMVLWASSCPQIRQCPVNTAVSPVSVLLGHVNDHLLDVGGGTRPSGTALSAAVVLFSDQSLVPAQQRLRRHDRGELSQELTAQSFGPGSQATPLVVVSCKRRSPSCSRRTRFSSRKYSII